MLGYNRLELQTDDGSPVQLWNRYKGEFNILTK